MRGGEEIAGIPISFLAGTVSVALFAEKLISERQYLVACVTLLCCLSCLMAAISKGHFKTIFAAFYFAGTFCASSHRICISAGDSSLQLLWTDKCLAALQDRICSIPFEDSSSGAIVLALLTGEREFLSPHLVSAFRDSGASHILALSGLHLGVIYMFINKSLSFLGHGRAAGITRYFAIVVSSGFYTLMTGAGPSTVRAFLFILINETGKLFPERKTTPVRTLLSALTFQVAVNPQVAESLGFQLSYLAMAGIVVLYPVLSSWYPDSPVSRGHDPLKKLWKDTALTISCQTFTAPLVWFRFRTFPKYFIITNLTAMPLVSAIMVISIVVLVFSALGISHGILVSADEFLIHTLLEILERISGL